MGRGRREERGLGMLSQGEDHILHKLDVLSNKNARRRMSWNINILTTPTEYLSLGSIGAASLMEKGYC